MARVTPEGIEPTSLQGYLDALGSMSLPWSLTLVGGGSGGVGWLLGRVFGAWQFTQTC